MRDTIDFGIDLGTTNSAIAVAQGGDVVIIKNNDNWDITPSVVYMPRRGTIQVGLSARNRIGEEPDDVASEFKLEMGLANATRHFAAADVTLTPTQLSAEVLRSLRADAEHALGGSPDAAVITVPAAFALNQNKATKDAAELAGLTVATPLVQEPTAAAFAYGFHTAEERAHWLVFDFGGGTFDAAVVSKRDGDLRVLNHAGDPYLGGKLIDWAIVERVLAPAAARALDLTDFRRDNERWRGNFAKLKGAAEEAKIQLSRRTSFEINTELTTVDGRRETFSFTLDRAEVDAIAEPFYVRAVNLCRNALADGGLGVGDIDRVLLVGGVTLAPGLRERLADPVAGLGLPLDFSLDPTTVVARGAAIFASTLRRPVKVARPSEPGRFTVDLAYEPAVTTNTPMVAGRLHASSTIDWTGYSVILSNIDAREPFRSPRVAVNAAGSFACDVYVESRTSARFTVELTDPAGTRQHLEPDTLTITHRDVEFAGVRLTKSLGIQLADRAFAPMVHRNATLPTRVREVFRTSDALRRDDTDAVVRIPVLQGERRRGDRNQEVGMLEIRPRDVRIDLPAGTEVEVTFEVDTSSLVTVVADVPLVQAQFVAEIALDKILIPEPAALREMLDEAEKRLASLRTATSSPAAGEAARLLSRLDKEGVIAQAREQVRAAATDAGAAATADDRLRNLHAALDDIEDAADLPEQQQRLDEILAEANALVSAIGGPSDRQELAELRRRAAAIGPGTDPAMVRTQVERAVEFLVELERRSPDWPAKLFYVLIEQGDFAAGDRRAAEQLFLEGRGAIARGDRHGLEAVNQRLVRLLPAPERSRIVGVVSS